METLKEERAELYAHVSPPGIHIPTKVAPFPMDDNIPGKEDIVEAVMRLQLHCVRGLSGMRAEHLRLWLCAAK